MCLQLIVFPFHFHFSPHHIALKQQLPSNNSGNASFKLAMPGTHHLKAINAFFVVEILVSLSCKFNHLLN